MKLLTRAQVDRPWRLSGCPLVMSSARLATSRRAGVSRQRHGRALAPEKFQQRSQAGIADRVTVLAQAGGETIARESAAVPLQFGRGGAGSRKEHGDSRGDAGNSARL